MSKPNRGKEFEAIFKRDWLKTFPNSLCYRLKDDTSMYRGASRNPCDFFCYTNHTMYMLEVKSHYENTFPFSDLRQYEDLLSYKNSDVDVIGVIIWFIDHDRVIFVDIDTIEQMKKDGQKSINIRLIDKQGYKYTEIPSTKMRVFMKSDYSVLIV